MIIGSISSIPSYRWYDPKKPKAHVLDLTVNQVYVPRTVLQLSFESSILRFKGCYKSDRIYTHVQ